MRKFFLIIIAILSVYAGKSQICYTYNKDKSKNLFELIDNVKVVSVESSLDLQKVQEIKAFLKKYGKEYNELNDKMYKVGLSNDNKDLLCKMMNNDSSKVHFCNLLMYEDSTIQWTSNRLFVKIFPYTNLSKLLTDNNIPYCGIKQFGSNPNVYIVSLTGTEDKSIEYANKLFETGDVIYAQPIFWKEIKPSSNPYFSYQWGLNNTGQYAGTSGFDINVQNAWNISTGTNIKVAVIDEGVDLTHPDLYNNLLQGYDATDAALGGSNGSCKGNDAHGTCCAGIIAAEDNNIGVVGVAYNANVIPIRIAYVNSVYPHNWITCEDWIVDGLNMAWDYYGADVLSNSWGGGSNSNAINDEIEAAVENGRNGKGCVVSFASGNYNQNSVLYPASLPQVIAVGAISPCGERKSPTSCDTETTWGSNYGTALSIVAPGVLIPTTDIQGAAGYNPNMTIHTDNNGILVSQDFSNTDYTIWFNGTSSACPHVSGVAALILSANPNLTGQQVRDIIETTAQKIRNVDTDPLNGLYSYAVSSDHPNGSWNNQVGYGLVDAYAAVQAAVNYNTDLYVRDYATDDGTEPSVTDIMWNSPDIWVENLYGNVIQNPTGGTPCYVCVEVHNRTNIASSGTETLLLNWAKAGVDLQWNHNWIGTNYFNCGGTYVAKGGVITSGETIPAIPANGSTVVRVLWTPPMPSNYSNCTEFNTDPWHFCLAARVHDGNTIPNENSTNYGMGAFTLNSNNVAWKNISIMNSSVNTAVVSVSKPANMTSSLSIEYVEHPNTYGETLSQFARVNMYFDTNLTSAWNLGGSHFSGVKVNGTGEFMVINDTAVLSDIMLDTGLVCTMLTEVNFFSNKTPKDNVFEFDIMLYSGTTFIGAEHYVAIKDKKGGIKAIARDDTKSFAGDEVTFYAETNNSNVSYKWYSQNGETLGTGTDLTVYPRQSQSYILEVKSDDEGFIDMDTVCVQICRGAIVGLSPNPTSDILNIEYRLEENISSATVSISNGLGIVMRTIPVSNTQNRNTVQTNIQGLTSGRYSVELKLPNGEILDAKSIIVQ